VDGVSLIAFMICFDRWLDVGGDEVSAEGLEPSTNGLKGH